VCILCIAGLYYINKPKPTQAGGKVLTTGKPEGGGKTVIKTPKNQPDLSPPFLTKNRAKRPFPVRTHDHKKAAGNYLELRLFVLIYTIN
jgi:hypothetical protein